MKIIRVAMAVIGALLVAACSDTNEVQNAGRTPSSTTQAPTASHSTPIASQAAAEVLAIVHQPTYQVGEQIVVTLANSLPDDIYAPVQDEACSRVIVERYADNGWEAAAACTGIATPDHLTIPEESQVTAPLITTDGVPDIQGPFVSEPVEPRLSSGNLPTATADPSITVPEGSTYAPSNSLGPGVYRLAFEFAIGSTSGPAETVYSEQFTVTE